MEQGYRVGEWLVQPQRNLISRGELEVHLEHKVMEVLDCLARHPGGVVTKEELFQAVWSNAFVTDDVLTHSIYELRKALGDSHGRCDYIQTIPRVGYRLIPEVQEVEKDAEAPTGFSASSAPASKLKESRLLFRLAGVSLLVALVLVMLFLWPGFDRDPARPSGPFRVRPVTSDGVGKGNPQLSPDGQMVVYSMNRESNIDIYVQSLAEGSEPRRLTDHPAPEGQPVWAPDGTMIAFMRWNVGGIGGSLYTIPAPFGGLVQKVVDVDGPMWTGDDTLFLGFLSWSPDGQWIAKAEKYPEDRPSRIVLISPRTGEKKPLTEPLDGTGDCCPSFSPDGTRLAFFRNHELQVKDFRSGGVRQLTNEWYEMPSSPTWTPDEREIIFAASRSDRLHAQLFRVGAAGGTPQPVAGTGIGSDRPHLRGTRLVFVERQAEAGDIWRIPGPNSDWERRPERVIQTSRRYLDFEISVSPDGKSIAFQSDRTGFPEIWVASADGMNPRQLTNDRHGNKWPAWSPDGRLIAFISQVSGAANVCVVDVEGGTPRPLTSDSSGEDTPSWSHDGRWIYFRSNRSGSRQIWKMPWEGGEAFQLTRKGGSRPLESSDGHRVYYYLKSSDVGGTIWRVPMEGGLEEEVLAEEVSVGNWDVKGNRLYFGKRNPGEWFSIHSLDLETGMPTQLFRQEGPLNSWDLAVSPDERWIFYVLKSTTANSDIMLVENFR